MNTHGDIMKHNARRLSFLVPVVVFVVVASHYLAAWGQTRKDVPPAGTKDQGQVAPPNISSVIRAGRDPKDASFSGKMYMAVHAALAYRAALKPKKLHPTELAVENFVFTVRMGRQAHFLPDRW
jgi:hypothetical protein